MYMNFKVGIWGWKIKFNFGICIKVEYFEYLFVNIFIIKKGKMGINI